jgi:hypothetical protein
MSENLYETSGKLKVLMDYSDGGKPNWYMVINDMDNVDHRAYSNQDLSLYKKKLDAEETILISAKGGTATHKSGKNAGKNFIQKAIISDWLSEDKEEKPDVAPVGLNGNTIKGNTEFDNSLKIAEMTLLYKTCMQAVNDDELLGSLEEGNRKDISTTFFLSLQRR